MKKILAYLKKMLTQRSTYAGIAVLATVAGAPAVGLQVDQIGQAVGLIVGTAAVAADTSA
jgi:hypothetical protein